MKIKRQTVTSSQIDSIGYDPASLHMDVAFKQHKPTNPQSVYRYNNVPPEVHQAFLTAESKGKYFRDYIKKFPAQYPYRKLTPEEAAP